MQNYTELEKNNENANFFNSSMMKKPAMKYK